MIHFIFIVPVHPDHHTMYVNQWHHSIDQQEYPREYRYCLADGKKQGQVYWINRVLDSLDEHNLMQFSNTYINFHGIDDYLQDRVLWELSKVIEDKDWPRWLYGGHYTESQRKRDREAHPAQEFNLRKLKHKNYIAGGSVFVRADVYKNRRFRDLAFGQGADWDMWMRIGQEYPNPLVLKDFFIYTERLGTSTIRPLPGKLSTKIFNRIKYPVWRIQRCFLK